MESTLLEQYNASLEGCILEFDDSLTDSDLKKRKILDKGHKQIGQCISKFTHFKTVGTA